MFLKYKVDIPVVPGKLVRKNRGGHTYIEYEYDRIYDPVKQYTYPKRASIGRVDPEDPTRMTPNENFLKYFPDVEIPEEIGATRLIDLRIWRNSYLTKNSVIPVTKRLLLSQK